jgi:PAS domain S-box-containing protein
MEKIRILHIDDNVHDRILVRDALEKEHEEYEVVEADNRAKFEKNLSEGTFDLVLSDFNILGFDGLQVLQIVKERKPDLPVIIVTGTGSEEIAIQAMKMGASDYVIKSASHLRGIAHTIQMVLENKKTQDERKLALAAQRESEDLYHTIFENSSVAILLTIPDDGQILSANGFACELFEMTEEEIRNTGRNGLIDMNDTRWPSMVEQREKFGRAKGELTFIKKGGQKFQAEYSTDIFKNKEGEVRTSLVIRDLTEQKKAEKQLRTLSNAIEQSPTSIIITDAQGTIEFVNNKFTSVMQYSMEEVIGNNPRIFNQGHMPQDEFDAMWQTLRAGKIWYGEFGNRKKDGSRFIENVVISPILKNNGAICNYVLIMEDITEKKKMLNDLIEAKEKAEESDRLKTAFLHNISHEIRTPMNAIVGFSGFLNDPDLPNEKRKVFTDVIVQSSEQLLSIITDIISIATVEAGQEKICEDEVDLNSLFRLLYDQFILKVQKKNIAIEYHTSMPDEDADIVTDYTKLTEILSNLINNAVKFTDEGRVDYGYELKDGYLEFYVRDTGIGVPSEMHEEIFKRFRQIEYTANRKFGGSGLGLSISKSYVELLGGEIWLKSEPGKGSEFHFTIPYRRVSRSGFSEQYSGETSFVDGEGYRTLLIAEDEDTNFMLLAALLSEMKYHIIRAVNGIEAVAICHSNPNIDLVLIDIKMPELDGFEATRRIREFRPELPIIAQTAFTTDSDRKMAMDCGCVDFICKPIDKKELLAKISAHLNL